MHVHTPEMIGARASHGVLWSPGKGGGRGGRFIIY